MTWSRKTDEDTVGLVMVLVGLVCWVANVLLGMGVRVVAVERDECLMKCVLSVGRPLVRVFKLCIC